MLNPVDFVCPKGPRHPCSYDLECTNVPKFFKCPKVLRHPRSYDCPNVPKHTCSLNAQRCLDTHILLILNAQKCLLQTDAVSPRRMFVSLTHWLPPWWLSFLHWTSPQPGRQWGQSSSSPQPQHSLLCNSAKAGVCTRCTYSLLCRAAMQDNYYIR